MAQTFNWAKSRENQINIRKKEFMTSNAPASVPATNAPPVKSSNASAQEANTTN